MNEGSLSVENDFGRAGTDGGFEAVGGGWVAAFEVCCALDELKNPLKGLFVFLVRTRVLVFAWSLVVSLVPGSSGMVVEPVKDFPLPGSTLIESFFDSSTLATLPDSFVGDDDRDCDEIHDFRLSLLNDRPGEMGVGSTFFWSSWRLRLSLGSSEGSRLLLEKENNLDDRREFVGLNCSGCSTCGGSSDDGLEPPEDV